MSIDSIAREIANVDRDINSIALTPIPSLLIFSARETTFAGVLSLDIGVPVRSLNRLPHP